MNASQPKLPSVSEMTRAFLDSDRSYDGIFVTGVKSTGIFCRPSCSARKPRLENIEFFATIHDALFAGYRACKRCTPLEDPQAAPDWVRTLLQAIDADPDRRWQADDLRSRGIDPARARRWFQKHYGMTFSAYSRARRLGRAFDGLRRGEAIDDAVFVSGFNSHSGFRSAYGRVIGATPGADSEGRTITTRLIETSLGPLVAGVVDEGVCLLEFSDRRMLEKQLAIVRRRFTGKIVPGSHRWLDALERQLREYFAGARSRFEVPLIAPGSPFQMAVWQELGRIPVGQTISYQELANRLGRPDGCRAVGTANGMNRIAILIPCHRVVNKNGALGGYGGGVWRKQRLLELEARIGASPG
jgi:AraC family transcriptional regulator of adaptative response/methylated-DNA-[protein]-cysteine methyltransferase